MAKKIPLRQCVGCGEMKGKKEMLRVLKTPEDEIFWMQPAKKTDVVHIYADRRNVCRKPGRIKD